MNSFAESAYGRRICLLEFAFVLKMKTIKNPAGKCNGGK